MHVDPLGHDMTKPFVDKTQMHDVANGYDCDVLEPYRLRRGMQMRDRTKRRCQPNRTDYRAEWRGELRF